MAGFLHRHLKAYTMRHPIFAAATVTAYLVIYCILSQLPTMEQYAFYMFLASPALVIWMALAVLKDCNYICRTLGDQEFGYQDKLPSQA